MTRLRRSWLVHGLLILLLSSQCLAWGADGHRITGYIATHYLTPQAQAAIRQLMGDQSLATISTWADEIKSQPRYDWAKPLHYVNMPYGAESYDPARDCRDGQCVVGAIDHYANVLRNPHASRDEKVEALRFLVHFVGDLHQPLHACYGEDRGGNMVRVKFFGRDTNLHRVWDSDMLDRQNRVGWKNYADRLIKDSEGRPVERIRETATPAGWANESFAIARKHAYDAPRDGSLGAPYHDRNISIVDQRLTAAGVRMADLLNEIFADGTITVAESTPAEAPPAEETAPPAPTKETAFAQLITGDPCGNAEGNIMFLRNTHATHAIRVRVRKSWDVRGKTTNQERTMVIRPGESHQKQLGCNRQRMRGNEIRAFTWTIESVELIPPR